MSLLDKIRALSHGELGKSVVKACSHIVAPPKEKHVKKLLEITKGSTLQGEGVLELMSLLRKRLLEPDWIVVSKALIVYHRLFREGGGGFLDRLFSETRILRVDNFMDRSNGIAIEQSHFIHSYGKYLQKRVKTTRDLGFDLHREPRNSATQFRQMSGEEVTKALSLSLGQMQAILDINVCPPSSFKYLLSCSIVHQITPSLMETSPSLAALAYVVEDSLELFRCLNEGVLKLLSVYFKMPIEEAKRSLDVYKQFAQQCDRLIRLYDTLRPVEFFRNLSLPNINAIPESVVQALEEHIGKEGTEDVEIEHLLVDGKDAPTEEGNGDVEDLLRFDSPQQMFPKSDADGLWQAHSEEYAGVGKNTGNSGAKDVFDEFL